MKKLSLVMVLSGCLCDPTAHSAPADAGCPVDTVECIEIEATTYQVTYELNEHGACKRSLDTCGPDGTCLTGIGCD